MRYVEKHFDAPAVIQHEYELASVNLDEASLLKRKETEELDGNILYKKQIRSTEYIPHWRDLQVQMCQDQGGVCCYCGQKLQFPDTQHYSPLQADCASHFSYKLNGEVKGSDNEAEEDIETLNLNCHGLKERRRKQMLAYSFLTTEEMLDIDSLKAYRQAVEKRDANGNHSEFYFVIADLLDQLLPAV